MSNRINNIIDQIGRLEEQLWNEVRQQERKFKFELHGRKVKFEQQVLQAHRNIKVAIIPWLWSSRMRNILSAPFIYAMVIPILLLDITITLYQHICFRLYDVQRVSRGRYIVLDRHQLAYLNGIEKLNCVYCGYGNGVVAYAREIIARTEQYWCPIKHARKVAGVHKRYQSFLDYGDAEGFQAQRLKFREQMSTEKDTE